MFKTIKSFIRDRHTVIALHSGAERYAQLSGEEKPGAEHFLLSSLELPDGTAKKAFIDIGIDPNTVRRAINKQYNDALNSNDLDITNLDIDNSDVESVSKNRLFPNTANPSGRFLIREIIRFHEIDLSIPLLGAHVVIATTSMKTSVIARTLKAMEIDNAALHSAAQRQLDTFLQ